VLSPQACPASWGSLKATAHCVSKGQSARPPSRVAASDVVASHKSSMRVMAAICKLGQDGSVPLLHTRRHFGGTWPVCRRVDAHGQRCWSSETKTGARGALHGHRRPELESWLARLGRRHCVVISCRDARSPGQQLTSDQGAKIG
jgi:hypothetical protein